MKRRLKFLLVPVAAGLLALAITAPVLAGPADGGLYTAVSRVIANGLADPGNPANFGTHNASCTVTGSNPATSLVDPNC